MTVLSLQRIAGNRAARTALGQNGHVAAGHVAPPARNEVTRSSGSVESGHRALRRAVSARHADQADHAHPQTAAGRVRANPTARTHSRVLARDAVLIAYPDFRPEIPGVGRPLALGHAGVLLIDNGTGRTRYYEYGRYDPENLGLVRRVTVPDVVMHDGQPTQQSLQAVLRRLSASSGHHGRIVGAYVRSDEFAAMDSAAAARLAQNSDAHRRRYGVTDNNCATFGAEVINTDPAIARPWIVVNPSPNNYVDEYIEEGHRRVEFTPARTPTRHTGGPAAHRH